MEQTDPCPMHAMAEELDDKDSALENRIRSLGDLMVAYSGGVDSAFLAWKAHQVLSSSMLAVIADSPSLPRKHFEDALRFAEANKIPTKVLATSELQNAEYAKNDQLRCFHCKNELFTVMEAAKTELGYRHIAYGMNVDDRGDFRPGQTAARQHGVLAPLAEVGLTKADIRSLARRAGLSVWDKPASACLSSRIAYGIPVNRETLARVEQAEEYLRSLGLRQFRVRDHGDLARIEVAKDEMEAILVPAQLKSISKALKATGFTYVAIDCEGYRSGSMNAVLGARAS